MAPGLGRPQQEQLRRPCGRAAGLLAEWTSERREAGCRRCSVQNPTPCGRDVSAQPHVPPAPLPRLPVSVAAAAWRASQTWHKGGRRTRWCWFFFRRLLLLRWLGGCSITRPCVANTPGQGHKVERRGPPLPSTRSNSCQAAGPRAEGICTAGACARVPRVATVLCAVFRNNPSSPPSLPPSRRSAMSGRPGVRGMLCWPLSCQEI